ncbi:MAG: hypothetical protein AB8C13_11070 [Phycisphaerales bacterium]
MTMFTGLGILGTVGLAVLGFGFVAAMIVYIIKASEEAKRRAAARIAAMQALAAEHGLSFVPHLDSEHDERYYHFGVFQRGFDKFAYNSISGEIELAIGDGWSGAGLGATGKVQTGDFKYKTRETTTTTDSKGRTTTRTRIVNHAFSYFILELPFEEVPDLMIRREHLFDKIASAFGKNDIDFESAEFSRKFYVKSGSRKFAYDVIHQRMMEFLLETKPGIVDMEQGRICLTDGMSVWDADRFGASLDWTLRYLEHWPAFLVKDLTEGKQV